MILKHPYIVSLVSGAIAGCAAVVAALATTSASKFIGESGALSSSDVSAVGGALLGAVVGGVISYLLQVSAFRRQSADRDEQLRTQRRALAEGLAFKMMTIVNDHSHLKKHCDEAVERVRSHGGSADHPVTYLQPIMNTAGPVTLETPEMGMLLSLGNPEIFNRVMESAPIHNSIMPVWDAYSVMKADLNSAGAASVDMETGIGELVLRDDNAALAVKFFEANLIAKQLMDRASRDYAESSATLTALIGLLREKAGLRFNIAIDEAQPGAPR